MFGLSAQNDKEVTDISDHDTVMSRKMLLNETFSLYQHLSDLEFYTRKLLHNNL